MTQDGTTFLSSITDQESSQQPSLPRAGPAGREFLEQLWTPRAGPRGASPSGQQLLPLNTVPQSPAPVSCRHGTQSLKEVCSLVLQGLQEALDPLLPQGRAFLQQRAPAPRVSVGPFLLQLLAHVSLVPLQLLLPPLLQVGVSGLLEGKAVSVSTSSDIPAHLCYSLCLASICRFTQGCLWVCLFLEAACLTGYKKCRSILLGLPSKTRLCSEH